MVAFCISLQFTTSTDSFADENPVMSMDRVATALNADDVSSLIEEIKQIKKTPARNRDLLYLNVNESIPLMVEWERIRDSQDDQTKIEASHFVGFLEGLARVRVPQWWSQRVLKCSVIDRNVRFERSIDDSGLVFTDGEVVLWGDGRIENAESGGIKIISGLSEVTVAKQAVFGAMRLGVKECVTYARDPTQAYVSFFGHIGTEFELVAIDNKTDAIQWTQRVWSAGIKGTSGAKQKFDHQVQIVPLRERVFVFGACLHGVYCECFRTNDGAPLFRFTNTDVIDWQDVE